MASALSCIGSRPNPTLIPGRSIDGREKSWFCPVDLGLRDGQNGFNRRQCRPWRGGSIEFPDPIKLPHRCAGKSKTQMRARCGLQRQRAIAEIDGRHPCPDRLAVQRNPQRIAQDAEVGELEVELAGRMSSNSMNIFLPALEAGNRKCLRYQATPVGRS